MKMLKQICRLTESLSESIQAGRELEPSLFVEFVAQSTCGRLLGRNCMEAECMYAFCPFGGLPAL